MLAVFVTVNTESKQLTTFRTKESLKHVTSALHLSPLVFTHSCLPPNVLEIVIYCQTQSMFKGNHFVWYVVAVRIKQFTVELPILFISLIATVYHFSTFQPSCNQTLDSLLQLSALMQEASYNYIHFAIVINFTPCMPSLCTLTTHRISNSQTFLLKRLQAFQHNEMKKE